ncbi:MAG: DUF4399 domain-containing protein [Pseudomonadota bacterium]|nr:DUF4399 domain-containing protein [Pseudomonadota bacterium]|tara:strand:- start:103 stop:534 length:432 start_codon:yes stop_codon:yes gene_type:complete
MHFIPVLSFLISIFFNISVYGEEWERSDAPDGAKAYIISPKSGQVLSSPITVKFGLLGMGVAPAGVEYPDTGHHHLIINREVKKFNQPLPSGEPDILHFGGGQTETVLDLEEGDYELYLILGDHDHVPHASPIISEKIKITIK